MRGARCGRRSPIAAEYRDVDEPGLVRMALLWANALSNGCSAAELGEFRQLETAYRLNPAARRRLAWRLDEPRKAPVAPRPTDELAARVIDLKSRLARG